MYFQNITVSQLCDDMITPDLYDELMLFLMCEELSKKTSWLDVHALGINNTLQKCHLYCVVNCHDNDYIKNIRKEGTLLKYKNVSYVSTNKKESFSQLSPIVSNDKPGYVEKLSLQPLLPKVKKKKNKRSRKRSKKEEEWVTTWPEHIPRIDFYPNGQKFTEDGELDCIHYYLEDKSVGTIEDDFDYDMHVTFCDWENDDNATYDLENLFGTNSESCHNHEGNYSLAAHHLPKTQLIYSVQVVYDIPTPTITNEKDYSYVEGKSTFLHVDLGNNALCDTYIVEFIKDPTENHYERGTYAYIYFNNIKVPLFMLKVLKLHLFCLPMPIALCF